jgi:integrase
MCNGVIRCYIFVRNLSAMFILNRPQLPTTEIMLLYKCSDGRLKMSLGEKVSVDKWNRETERITGKSTTNTLLNRIAAHINEMETRRKTTGQSITKASLKASILQLLGRQEESQGADFWEWVEQFISDRESGRVLTKGSKRFAKETLKHYRHTRDNLMLYQTATGDRLTFATITPATRQRIIEFFQKHKDHATNSIGKTIKNFKVFLKEAYIAGITTNQSFSEFRVPAENTPDVYLTLEELASLEALQPVSGHLLARDWFLIECFTGLRVSDARRLQPGNFTGTHITISNEKTDEKVVLPIHPVIQRILQRWNGLPPAISEQKINLYIKELSRDAGILQPVLYTVTKGGQRKDYYLPKCEMISNHTGRRSFITNLIRMGTPDQIVMKLAGIRKASTLQRYVKLSQEEVADIAAKLPFFT